MHLSSEASVLIVDVITDDATPTVRRFRTFGSFSHFLLHEMTKIAFKNRETRLRLLRGNPHWRAAQA